jgi:putative lipoic acid-binding regulatory protein
VQLPSVELLESRHQFPCSFTFKVIGTAADNFTARVVSHVRDELGMEQDPPYSLRSTKGGKHVAISLEPHCESAQQVLAIYSRLSGMDGLVMLL